MAHDVMIRIPNEWKEEIDKEINETKTKMGMKGRIPRVQFIRMNFRIIKMPRELKNAIKKR